MSGNRKKIGFFTGNAHTFFPRSTVHGVYDRSLSYPNVDILYFLGLEAGQFSDNSFGERRSFDYQYSTLYDYATLVSLDALIISYGAITTFQQLDAERFFGKFSGIPCVIISDDLDVPMSASVQSANYEGMHEAVSHLIEKHGFTRILYVSGPSARNQDSRERLEAYRAAMAEHGLKVEENMIAYGDYTEYVDDLIETLLDEHPDAEAIASANDEMCRSIYRVARKRGLTIGKDLAVTGFDDIESAATDDPPLTTLRQDGRAMGENALDMAMEFLSGTYPKHRTVPVKFIERESCGCTRDEENERTQLEDLIQQYDEMRVSYHRSLTGPALIQDLINYAETPAEFFSYVGRMLYAHGAKHSYLLMLPKTRVVKSLDGWKRPRHLHVTLLQDGESITVSANLALHRVNHFTEIINSFSRDEETGGHFFHFLLFDGQRNYGILGVEIDPFKISDFSMIATQLGISLHFQELTMKQAEYREKLQEQNTILNFSASNDELTGLLNRRGIFEHTLSYLKGHEGEKMLALLIDLDHLKEINDTFGHAAGDFALTTVADILKITFSGEDAAIGRYGGDEFLAIVTLGDADPEEKRIALTIRLKDQFKLFNEGSEKPYYIEASVGAAFWTGGEELDFAGLIERVDKKLYEAKQYRRETIRK